MREGCFQVIETGGLHVAGLINQAFYTVIRNHFLYLQLSGEPDSSILLADILDEGVSLLSLGEIWTISFASRISKAFITCMENLPPRHIHTGVEFCLFDAGLSRASPR